MNWVVVGFIIACGALGLGLKLWHRRLITYLYREHRATCERLDAELFERHERLPGWTYWGVWSWPGLRFFLFRKYEILEDPELLSRARRFRFALGVWLLTCIIVAMIAFYLHLH
jgi:hypothetical protein